MGLEACATCRRHVRARERCPFCGSTERGKPNFVRAEAPRRWLLAAAAAGGLGGSACPAYGATAPLDDDDWRTLTTSSTTGGSGGAGGSHVDLGPCGVDCSQVETTQCLKSECNVGQFPEPVGTCVWVPTPGAACHDGLACSQGDTCNAWGLCEPGPGCGGGGEGGSGGAGGAGGD